MAPNAFPPTPAPSTDIAGKSGSRTGSLDATFALPPAAIGHEKPSSVSSAASSTSHSSYRPVSPPSPATATPKNSSTATKRKLSATKGTANHEGYALPPPPTRTRKIIQMKPGAQSKADLEPLATSPSTKGKATEAPATNSKKKQPGSNTAQGKKIARRTAHSLIERRRRSKMNEEFGVLKDMIPACRGQEMHKLAILQASIEYMRYLESCITELKSHNVSDDPSRAESFQPSMSPSNVAEEEAIDEESDEDMDEDEPVSPMQPSPAIPTQSAHSSTAPTPTDPFIRRDSRLSMGAGHSSLPSSTPTSANVSPAINSADARSEMWSPSFLPPSALSSSAQSTAAEALNRIELTSPAILPQSDQEASAALLMLNNDRRSWSSATGSEKGRGMSVKDLLAG